LIAILHAAETELKGQRLLALAETLLSKEPEEKKRAEMKVSTHTESLRGCRELLDRLQEQEPDKFAADLAALLRIA